MDSVYHVHTAPVARKDNQVQGKHYRFTLLTPSLVRLEYSPEGVFEDRATQSVWFRDFPKTDFTLARTPDGIRIDTQALTIVYDEKPFSPHGLSIQVKGGLTQFHSIWHYGDPVEDLGGTARTLDEADGEIPLEHGILSRRGFSLLDDSHSQILLEDGWITPRPKGIADLYFWGYGRNYLQALKDFYHLCGSTPMLPRFALGNWWSRYYKYTEKSYLELMERFRREEIPFSVAVIDMDWHLVDIPAKYGSGWTGYTWNRELFPDPKGFLERLHAMGLRVTLNVHPAEGVQAHEKPYREMAAYMGVDADKEIPVACDPADEKFMEGYFRYLHHPLEEEGVDFWWIDWQQGSHCKVEGLDPLWIFNHYHFLDSGRAGKRPLTFSRYTGPGSHRYPVGFSGDTVVSWESLDFQPYFTLTASNIGYGWWSHDIGGHMLGYKNGEMTVRWVQFGVFSPILRLHSTCGAFNGKEPWRYKPDCREAMGEMLRLRHRLIPYLYTMNYRNYREGVPLVMPMYYLHPEDSRAYAYKNQYYFGSELLVAPITAPMHPGINRAGVKVWLPEGTWYDLFTGMVYAGNREMYLFRDLNSIPVLAKAGAILPTTPELEKVDQAPESLTIYVFAGADGDFTLYEDDNVSCDYRAGICCTTPMSYREGEEAVFTIGPAQGERNLIPQKRNYRIRLVGFRDTEKITVNHSYGKSYDSKCNTLVLDIPGADTGEVLKVRLDTRYRTRDNQVLSRCFDFLDQAEISFLLKDRLYRKIQGSACVPELLSELAAEDMPRELLLTLTEILTA